MKTEQSVRNNIESQGLDTELANELNDKLFGQYGLVLPSAALIKVLGYPSPIAFRKALMRGSVNVPLFQIPNRRGRFALARDVAIWLSQQARKGPVQ